MNVASKVKNKIILNPLYFFIEFKPHKYRTNTENEQEKKFFGHKKMCVIIHIKGNLYRIGRPLSIYFYFFSLSNSP